MSFLRAYSSVDAGDPRATAAARVALTRAWMASRPHALFAELRQDHPIFPTPAFVLLTRHAEVREVLLRDDVFVATPQVERLQPLLGGVLGGADGPTHEREAAALRLAIRRADLDAIAASAERAAGVALAAGRRGSRVDAIAGLLRPIVADFVASYLGVAGPEPEILLQWARTLARAAFCDDGDDPQFFDAAQEAAAELGGYIDVRVALRRTQIAVGGPAGDDALGRLLALQSAEHARLEDRRVRDMLVGVITCAVEPTIAAAAHAIHELARRPVVQARAAQALADGDAAALAAIVAEALRFAPPPWTPARVCTQAFTLARGSVHEIVLRPGTRVLASTFSADFDPAAQDDPELFRPGRPTYQPLHFGGGLHACVGRHVAPVLLRAAVTALLRVGPVRPADEAADGPRLADGPFPTALPLELAT